jgi:ClpP class serine protease
MFARNFISIEDSEEVLRAIKLTPKDMPIDLIIHTPGGILLAAEQIANALSKHDAKVTVFVPHYAMSGGTLIALAADEIVMDENAVLGPVDPQIGQYAAVSILKVLEQKPISEVDDNTIILADMSKKAITQTRRFVYDLLISNDVPEEKAEELSTALTDGRWTHDYPIMYEEAKRLGLNVTSGIPEEVASLMHLYPQAGQRRPSVQYVPMPYQRPTSNGKE